MGASVEQASSYAIQLRCSLLVPEGGIPKGTPFVLCSLQSAPATHPLSGGADTLRDVAACPRKSWWHTSFLILPALSGAAASGCMLESRRGQVLSTLHMFEEADYYLNILKEMNLENCRPAAEFRPIRIEAVLVE